MSHFDGTHSACNSMQDRSGDEEEEEEEEGAEPSLVEQRSQVWLQKRKKGIQILFFFVFCIFLEHF